MFLDSEQPTNREIKPETEQSTPCPPSPGGATPPIRKIIDCLRLLQLALRLRGRDECFHRVLEPRASLVEPDLALFEAGLCHTLVAEKLVRPLDRVLRKMQLLRDVVQPMPGSIHEADPDVPEKHRLRSCHLSGATTLPVPHNY